MKKSCWRGTKLVGGGLEKNKLKQRSIAIEAFWNDSKQVSWRNLTLAINSVVLVEVSNGLTCSCLDMDFLVPNVFFKTNLWSWFMTSFLASKIFLRNFGFKHRAPLSFTLHLFRSWSLMFITLFNFTFSQGNFSFSYFKVASWSCESVVSCW